jgi:hypothetical protein
LNSCYGNMFTDRSPITRSVHGCGCFLVSQYEENEKIDELVLYDSGSELPSSVSNRSLSS